MLFAWSPLSMLTTALADESARAMQALHGLEGCLNEAEPSDVSRALDLKLATDITSADQARICFTSEGLLEALAPHRPGTRRGPAANIQKGDYLSDEQQKHLIILRRPSSKRLCSNKTWILTRKRGKLSKVRFVSALYTPVNLVCRCYELHGRP